MNLKSSAPTGIPENHPEKYGDSRLIAGLAFVVFFLLGTGVISFLNLESLNSDISRVTHTHDVISTVQNILALIRDAETGQRGFLLTGEEQYLVPYTEAVSQVESSISRLENLIGESHAQRDRISKLRRHMLDKTNELAETIQTRRESGFEAAQKMIDTDQGKLAMDAIRESIAEMEESERSLRDERLVAMRSAYRVTLVSAILSCLLGSILSGIIGYLVRRSLLLQRRQQWLLSGENGLAAVMRGDQQLGSLTGEILLFLTKYLDAQAGAVFVREGGLFQRVATSGVPAGSEIPETFTSDDGLLGQVVTTNQIQFLRDLPSGYLSFGSALGKALPQHLAIVPTIAGRLANGVIELGFLHPPHEASVELLGRISEPIGIAIRAAHDRSRVENLLEETQRQAEELQVQSEELRVSNEELEEQSRALRESQVRLEVQQTELEQSNAHLEEQTQLLESQRDELAAAQVDLQSKAREIEQASRYKSDFLANMSHELRTPLNSCLILAKLLADNPEGNLNDEQVKYAETIRSAGNDLLTLINDILDLSKIEAGHMEVNLQWVRLSDLSDSLNRAFLPLAEQKGLSFGIQFDATCPEAIESDRQRLEQILRNLLANAVKFTDTGKVGLSISRLTDGSIAFAVRDTGIGVAPEHRELIFEAFRQADGTTNRRFGGTGLGLSISRQLVRLLGGEIRLESELGRGSTFTIIVPEVYDQKRQKSDEARESQSSSSLSLRSERTDSPVARKFPPAESPIPANGETKQSTERSANIDDRHRLVRGRRTILVVEDDSRFSRLMYDLAKELGFQCLLASTAQDALHVATQYLPDAVVLDIGLPDHSGLSVLDLLKHEPKTRHIPVHVVSGMDYAETALSLGAVGYLLKPVHREQLEEALRGLEARLSQRLRRVLIVEDDLIQLESLKKLLGADDVETIGVSTANECLELLKVSTFDCLVLDLSLPDASGFSLLEKLSREDAYSFPPAIVYTGRNLNYEEEERLQRYSKSIIIKGAKSPERLLDEVTLFLHQVVAELPPDHQKMLERARSRDAVLENRRVLVVEDDVRNVFALTSILEPRGAKVEIARNGKEALLIIEKFHDDPAKAIDLVLMDVMMPEMDGLTATAEVRKRPEWRKLPIIMLTAKAMKSDQERCLAAGANDYLAKPLDVEKLLSLVRIWMPR